MFRQRSYLWCAVVFVATSRIFRSRLDVNSPDACVLTYLNFQNKNFVKTYLSSLVRSHLQHEIQNLTVSPVEYIKMKFEPKLKEQVVILTKNIQTTSASGG